MIRYTTVGKKLLVPMLLLLAVNCGRDDKADTVAGEPSANVKMTEVGQGELGDDSAIPTGDAGDSEKSPSKEIVLIAKPTLAESRFLDSVSLIKDKVCACKTMECGELAMRVMDKLDWTKPMSAATRKKIWKLRLDAMNCTMKVAVEAHKPTLAESEIIGIVTSTNEAVCACKDLECGMLAMKTMDPLREAKEPTAPTKKKIEKLIKEMRTCMVALSATPQ